MKKIFISYSQADREHAKRLYKELASENISVWFDLESLLPGQVWEQEIKKAILHTDFIIFLLSANSLDRRGYFLKEMRMAYEVLDTIPENQIFIIPVRLNDCNIPNSLKSIHYVDLFPDWSKGFSKILKSLGIFSKLKKPRSIAVKYRGVEGWVKFLWFYRQSGVWYNTIGSSAAYCDECQVPWIVSEKPWSDDSWYHSECNKWSGQLLLKFHPCYNSIDLDVFAEALSKIFFDQDYVKDLLDSIYQTGHDEDDEYKRYVWNRYMEYKENQ